jgi:hypothetical protein
MMSLMDDLDAWDARTRELLEKSYVTAGDGQWALDRTALRWVIGAPGVSISPPRWIATAAGSTSAVPTASCWQRCRPGAPSVASWSSRTDSSCCPRWRSSPAGLRPHLADRIWTGSVMSWSPSRQFTYVTALEDQVPPNRLGDLVARLLDVFVQRGGQLIISAYAYDDEVSRDLFSDLVACGHEPSGRIYIERLHRGPLITAWLDPSSASTS